MKLSLPLTNKNFPPFRGITLRRINIIFVFIVIISGGGVVVIFHYNWVWFVGTECSKCLTKIFIHLCNTIILAYIKCVELVPCIIQFLLLLFCCNSQLMSWYVARYSYRLESSIKCQVSMQVEVGQLRAGSRIFSLDGNYQLKIKSTADY